MDPQGAEMPATHDPTRRAAPRGLAVRAVALLEVEPELARHLQPSDVDQARRAVKVPLVTLPRGPFDGGALRVGTNPFGAIIVTGLVAHEISVLAQPALQLLGPGDFVHDGVAAGYVIARDHVWSAAQPTTLAVLDDHLLDAISRWPLLARALLERAAENQESTLLQLAIAQHPRVADRLVALFRMLAEKWGRMTGAGITIPMALTHEALGRLIGARRPTITLALKSLAAEDRLTRQKDGTWLVRDLGDATHDADRPLPVSEAAA
jgi:CRP/FNR family cyclic AMP-dependent transcriptional regulator